MTASAGSDAFGAIPGMDFLKNLMPGAGAASPAAAGMAWMLPTVDLEELDKRIKDLKAVQFWLEQNSRMLASTIQTLEVQRMTVATLKGMNVSMQEAMGQWAAAAQPAAPAATAAGPAEPTAAAAAEPAQLPAAAGGADDPEPGAAAEAILPQALQWWDQLSRQFAQIATAAVGTASAAVDGAVQSTEAPTASNASGAAPASATRTRSPRAATSSTASKAAATKVASKNVQPRPRSRARTPSQS